MARKKLIAGNWKMNKTAAEARELAEGLKARAGEMGRADVLVCAPFVYLDFVRQRVSGSNLAWGAQNLSEHQSGAYTGEVSAAMLSDFGCSHVIVGHSERRALYGETDAVVAHKFSATARQKIEAAGGQVQVIERPKKQKVEQAAQS